MRISPRESGEQRGVYVNDPGIVPLNKICGEQAHVPGQNDEINIKLIQLIPYSRFMFKAPFLFWQIVIHGFYNNWNLMLFCIFDSSSVLFVCKANNCSVDAFISILVDEKRIHPGSRPREENCNSERS
tara:strand:+ start:3003 stop:3386 length:384 start_codon:yes stop_codon:yes gene_type:complete